MPLPVPAAPTARRPRLATGDPHPKSRAEATDRAAQVAPVVQVAPDPADPVVQVATVPADRAAPAAPVGQVGQVGQATTDPVDSATTVPAVRADPATTVPADRADPDSTDLGAPADQVAHGTGMTSAGISTAPRGETDQHLGVLARRRDRHGTGRFRRPVDRGTTARSITGATTKTRSGIRSSTSGASTSSESGVRCEDDPAVRS